MHNIDKLIGAMKALRVFVIGDLILDHYIWGDATRISPEAPVPVVDIARDTWTAGGAANVALNIASLGARCTVAGCVGDDAEGNRLRMILRQRKVDVVSMRSDVRTIVKTRVLVQHQQLCRLDRESQPAEYLPPLENVKQKLALAVRQADAVILSDYAKGVLTDELVSEVTRLAAQNGTFVALDPKPKRHLKFRGLDLITPNRREALELARLTPPHGQFPAEEVCKRLHQEYATKCVVVTLGEDGMLLSSGGKVLSRIPTAAREVYDVSGAGDTALSALVLALTAGADLQTAAQFANAAAGVVVGKLGTAIVTTDEVRQYMRDAGKQSAKQN